MGKLKGRPDDPPITAQHPSIHSINHSIKGLSLDANQFCIECTFPAFQALGGGRRADRRGRPRPNDAVTG